MDATQTALIRARNAWNALATLFNPAIKLVAAVPALKPAADAMKSVATIAIAGAPALDTAIKSANLDQIPPMTQAESDRVKQALDQITVTLRSLEADTRFGVYALTVERGADGKVSVGTASVLR
jgi:hypothetical protein